MTIVSSTIIEDRAQKDGRRAVREQHTDSLSISYYVDYLAERGADASAMLATRAAQIDADLATSEVERNVQRAYDQLSPITNYSTLAQFRTRLRQEFQTATAWQAVRLGKFINGLGLTDAQLKALFGVDDVGLVTLKAKLTTWASKYDGVITEAGQ